VALDIASWFRQGGVISPPGLCDDPEGRCPLILNARQALVADVGTVSDILREAASWLDARGEPLWTDSELLPDRIIDEVADGLYWLAEDGGVALGTVRFQLEDPLFWPDLSSGEAVFVHRLAVRRVAAGGVVSSFLLQWAIERARQLGRPYLRLDCDAARPRLRAFYERFGFRHHSDRQVGPYVVARYEIGVGTVE
jgi:GNAT superfamily N-acetyltransferase